MTQPGRTGRTAAVYILLAGLQRGMPLLILPFITHVMLPAEYGAATMLTATALLLITVIAAPLESLVFRAAARGDRDSPAHLRVAGIYCYLLIPTIIAICAGGVALTVEEFLEVSGHIWAIELLAIGFQPAMTYFALPVVQARQQISKFASLASASVVFLATTKLTLLVSWKLGVLGWVISDLISAVLSAVLAMLMVRPPRVSVTITNVRSVAAFTLPLIPHRASFWAISSLSRPAMAIVSSLSQVGLLSLGLNVASIANLLLAEINRAVLPRYSREVFPAPTDATLGIVRFQIVLSFVIPAVVGAALALAGHWIFAAVYWPAFALTGIVLTGQAAYGIYCIPTNYLVQAAGVTKPVAFASGGGAAVMLVLLLVFGQRYGAVGAAYATAIGFIVMAGAAFVLIRILSLQVAWRTWNRCWPEAVLGMLVLSASSVALMLPVGSGAARSIAGLCLLVSLGAVLITVRRSAFQR